MKSGENYDFLIDKAAAGLLKFSRFTDKKKNHHKTPIHEKCIEKRSSP